MSKIVKTEVYSGHERKIWSEFALTLLKAKFLPKKIHKQEITREHKSPEILFKTRQIRVRNHMKVKRSSVRQIEFNFTKLDTMSLSTMSGRHQYGRDRDCKGIEKELSGDDPMDVRLDVYGSVCLNLVLNIGGLVPIIVIFFIVKIRAWTRSKAEKKPRFSTWLWAQFSIADLEKIDNQLGIDVGNFFLFQQYLIYFAFLQLFVCITLVLPLNLSGNYAMTLLL